MRASNFPLCWNFLEHVVGVSKVGYYLEAYTSTAAVQLWPNQGPDRLARLLHRHVAAGQLLRPRTRECGPRDSHARVLLDIRGNEKSERISPGRPCAFSFLSPPCWAGVCAEELYQMTRRGRRIYEPLGTC
jgi:hypothetical protein